MIVGIVVGILAGGSVVTFCVFLGFTLIFNRLGNGGLFAFIASYIVVALLGMWSFVTVRKGIHFGSGLLIGITGGLLGGISLCSALTGGLSNMH
jgi:hypothetical protein